jgi:hypothetical protein
VSPSNPRPEREVNRPGDFLSKGHCQTGPAGAVINSNRAPATDAERTVRRASLIPPPGRSSTAIVRRRPRGCQDASCRSKVQPWGEGIQPSIIEELVDVLRQLHRSQGLTILLVEQNLEFIAELAQRVLIIQKGAILRELRPEELRHADVLSEFVGVAADGEAPSGPAG